MTSVIPAPLETRITDGTEKQKVTFPQLIGPNITVTPRTDTSPRGKIFEDVLRGTTFWEAVDCNDLKETNEDETSWGNIFQVEWIRW
jgi:hypothetical protein